MGLWSLLFGWMGSGKLNIDRKFQRVGAAVEGDSSTVWKVKAKNGSKHFALKVISPSKWGDFARRFEKTPPPDEKDVLERFKHPRAPKLVAHGQTTTGENYLQLEWIDGNDLEQSLKYYADRLEGKRVKLLRQLAEVLKAMHDADVYHGSIQASNVIVSEDGENASLIDYGHTFLAEPAKEKLNYLRTMLMTTPGDYLAPEVHRPSMNWRQVELFAFGVVAYQMCTGHSPWEDEDHSTTVTRAFRTAKDIKKVNPKIPGPLAACVMGLLLGDPKARTSTIDDFLQRLPPDGSF